MFRHACLLLKDGDEIYQADALNIIHVFLKENEVQDFVTLYFELDTHAKLIDILYTSKCASIITGAYSVLVALTLDKPKVICEVR